MLYNSTNTEIQINEKDFIKFLEAQGITVKTNTRARGNLGICLKDRIDVSKKAAKERRISILAHEYAHKIHYDMEKESFNKGGSLEKLFNTQNISIIKKELLAVTNFVDENSKFSSFLAKKLELSKEIAILEKIIKDEYPDFKKSQPFKPINAYFRKNKSSAKYLLKYSNIKIIHPIFRKEEFYSIKTIDSDFPEIPESLRAYIKLKSCQREYNRIYRLKNKAEKYYNKPTELFARFIEGIFIDSSYIKHLAPTAYSKFTELLEQNYYCRLKELIFLARIKL